MDLYQQEQEEWQDEIVALSVEWERDKMADLSQDETTGLHQ